MKREVSRKEAISIIDEFFKREEFSSEEARKIKKLAMRYRLKLGTNRRRFCRRCFSRLEGKVRINRGIKSVGCGSCGFVNRWKIV